mmetsp:Transcript_11569/g.34373  ORF Transcript_11569/g.34373 Transcript_11569/m.34373 type:complete len:235 (+) Transcript_11569:469-1173(+)
MDSCKPSNFPTISNSWYTCWRVLAASSKFFRSSLHLLNSLRGIWSPAWNQFPSRYSLKFGSQNLHVFAYSCCRMRSSHLSMKFTIRSMPSCVEDNLFWAFSARSLMSSWFAVFSASTIGPMVSLAKLAYTSRMDANRYFSSCSMSFKSEKNVRVQQLGFVNDSLHPASTESGLTLATCCGVPDTNTAAGSGRRARACCATELVDTTHSLAPDLPRVISCTGAGTPFGGSSSGPS